MSISTSPLSTPSHGIEIRSRLYQEHNLFWTYEINGSKFALFDKEIQSNESFSLGTESYNVVLLAPIKTERNISIQALSIIVLNNLHAKNGSIDIYANGKFISLGAEIKSLNGNIIRAKDTPYFFDIIKERLEMIAKMFSQGISEKHLPTIRQALLETVDAINDPDNEDESDSIDVAQAFDFLSIPYQKV